ncbi:MAG: hypothetical protein A2540_08140 [Sulfurimonas sp. RIFOXYD2_FULL_37_8]|nr:MAG: hypothetical protein A2540_08140 [Sulfurimonas sp. RIFOXYD2_FULL_37_8]
MKDSTSQTLLDTTIIQLLKQYKWNELSLALKEINYDASINIQKQIVFAFKGMLLVCWWQDSITARQIFKHFPIKVSNPLIYFALVYGYIALGDEEKITLYMKNKPSNLPEWINNWLTLEYLGRSQKNELQINLVKKITANKKTPQSYVKIALLESLEYKQADISYLAQWIRDINLQDDTDPLSIALCLRTKIIDIADIESSTSALCQAKKVQYLWRSNEVLKTLVECDKLIQMNYLDTFFIQLWLSVCISLPQAKEDLLKRVQYAISLSPNSLTIKGQLATYALIHTWLKGDYSIAYNIVKEYRAFYDLENITLIKALKVFFGYILNLCISWQHNRTLYDNKLPNHKELYIFGESHSLSLSNINFFMNADNFHSNSNFILGIKMYHLSNPTSSYQAACLLEHFKFIKPNSDIMFTIGEIDTRPDEGIWQVHLKKEKAVDEILNDTVGGYIEFLYENLKDKNLSSVTIQGIPAPNYALEGDKDPKDKEGFLNMIKQVNEKLKELTLQNGWNFLDVYSATVGEDGISNKKWHIDGYHLSPIFYIQADQWLIKPESIK